VAQKFHFTVLRIEVTHASRGLSAIAELLVYIDITSLITGDLFPIMQQLAASTVWLLVDFEII